MRNLQLAIKDLRLLESTRRNGYFRRFNQKQNLQDKKYREQVRDGREYGPACPSNSSMTGSPQTYIDEDCLQLNVFISDDCRNKTVRVFSLVNLQSINIGSWMPFLRNIPAVALRYFISMVVATIMTVREFTVPRFQFNTRFIRNL